MQKAISIFLVLLSIAFNILAVLFYLQVFVGQQAYRNGATQAYMQVMSVAKEKGFVDLINGDQKITLIPKPDGK
jgi:hypothetical protein